MVLVPLGMAFAAWVATHVHVPAIVYVSQPVPVAVVEQAPAPVRAPVPEKSPLFDWDEFLDGLGIVNHRKFTAVFELGLFFVALAIVARFAREAARRLGRP